MQQKFSFLILGLFLANNVLASGDWDTSGTDLNYMGGNVGIGTTTPQSTLDLGGGGLTVDGSDNSGGHLKPGIKDIEVGRFDIGWGGQGGGNMSAYSKGHATRPGEFNFVFGGGADFGQMKFNHYNGSGLWSTKLLINHLGNVGIGTNSPCADCKLAVNGKIRAKEIVVDTGWADYVFDPSYDLMEISVLDKYIEVNGHLPNMPTAEEVQQNGVDLGEATQKLLAKVEELTLYVIQLKKENQSLHGKIEAIARLGQGRQ